MGADSEPSVPHEPLGRLFLRFLRYGLMAWGGPVVQIAMIREELVEDEHWITRDRFNRVLAVYQVLPGPETHELCVYFGMRSRGRVGGVLSGLGFMLPGFILMFALSVIYVRFGLNPWAQAAFATMQAAIAALIIRAVFRIGRHALLDRWLWALGITAFFAQLAGVRFALSLGACGLAYLLVGRKLRVLAAVLIAVLVALAVIWTIRYGMTLSVGGATGAGTGAAPEHAGPGPIRLLLSGLKAGFLTFGGAYTAIPLLQQDAVVRGGWLTNDQFLDGLALSGVLPAPLIIFSTFIGYIGGGTLGAVLMTLGIFFPATAFTLVGMEILEKVVESPRIRQFLLGVTAGVVGLIAATAFSFSASALTHPVRWCVFVVALVVLFRTKAGWVVPALVLGSGGVGLIANAL
jgi:chromate transporter